MADEDLLYRSGQARAFLREGGAIPSGVLRKEIEASWRRSLEHGLDCTGEGGPWREERADLGALLSGNRLLLDAVVPELNHLRLHQGQDALITLTDANATVLLIEGAACERLRRSGLEGVAPGACWSEAACGTNALGTALVERRAIQIDYGEHFLDRLVHFSCTSTPIANPHGHLLGVLDLTREGPLVSPRESLSLLSMAASQIESRLFVASYPKQVVLAFHRSRQYLDSPWQGLLALGLDGKVLAASAQACQLLGMTRETLTGRSCGQLFGSGMQPGRLQQGDTGGVETHKGAFFYKTLQAPARGFSVAMPARAGRAAQAGPDLDALAGGNPRYARTLRMARQGLLNGLPVLLLGETGSGKEVLARALHRSSTRSEKPFIAVNCAAIPEALIESELFGYREGAFTGSRRGGMVGRLQQAHGGTLFLDEIGDMPLALQVRLLRVLQERKVAPLGAGEEQDIDIALICATHCNLRQQVEEKQFREDLYYRINGISVRLPALRERDDIGGMIAALLDRFGAQEVRLDGDLMALLVDYHWPGNIRQLEMVLRTALAMREEDEQRIGLEHLPDSMLDELSARERPQSGRIRENELELIRQALERYQGNVSAAADALGISRATLYRKLKQLRD